MTHTTSISDAIDGAFRLLGYVLVVAYLLSQLAPFDVPESAAIVGLTTLVMEEKRRSGGEEA